MSLPAPASSATTKKKTGTYATFEEPSPAPAPPRTSRQNASLLSWLAFGYASAVLEKGRDERRLELDDLWELAPEYKTQTAYGEYKRAFLATGGTSAARAVVKTYWKRFLLCGLGSATLIACSIFAPAVLHEVINAFSQPVLDMEKLAPWIVAFFASRLVVAFTEPHVNFLLDTTMLQLTVSLKGLIFEKAMRRSLESKNDNDMVDVSNLVTADIDNLMWAGDQINTIWITPIQVSVVIYMLYNVLDVAAFAGLGVILFSMIPNYWVTKAWSDAYNSIMGYKDNRMKAVKEMFGAIQIVKLNAWESKFVDRIRTWRDKETAANAKYLNWMAVTTFVFWAVPFSVSLVSFATYAFVLGKELTAAKVFTAMVLFNAIRSPLLMFPEALQAVIQAKIALDRMSKYLSAEEIDPSHIARDVQNYAADVEISVENATFKWRAPLAKAEGSDSETTPLKDTSSPRENKTVLEKVDLTIRKGDFVVVHGAVGAGKSSLCAALLGELPSEQGKVFVRSRSIAYYSQQPWIQNMSIRDNILFGLPYDKTKYDRVIDACGLVKDIAMFPARDATEIGQKGVNLSGGQKARVSLARACYADADVYVLDSPLAAVDAIVQSEIFNKCLCDLLENKTVVLVTHLHDIITSDVANVTVSIEGGSAHVTHGKRAMSRRKYANLHTSAGGKEAMNKDIADDDAERSASNGILVKEEERKRGRVAINVFKAYLAAIGGWKVAFGYLLVLIIWQSFQVSSDLWLSYWTGSKSGTEVKTSVEYNMTVYALLGLGTGVFIFIRALMMSFAGVAAGRFLFDEMTKSLLSAPLRFFDENPIGRILNRYSEDISTIDYHLPFSFFGALVTTAVNFFQIAMAVYVIQWPGLFIIPLGWIYVNIASFYLSGSQNVSRLKKISTSPILSHLTQSEEGVTVLRSFGQSYVDRAITENFKLNDANNRVWYAQACTTGWFSVRVQLVGFGVVVLVVSTLLILHAYLSPGLVGLAFMYAVSIDLKLASWVNAWSWLERTMVSPERVLEYIGIPPEGHVSDRLIVTSGSTHGEWPQHGGIAFEDVRFAYKPGGDLVLKGLSFEICHNEKIGIVGRTGAGKSSLTMAIFRINELVSGRIMIDGVDISTVNLQTLRSRMSIIPQVPVLFKGPLRAYMDPFEEYDDAAIWLAFEKVALKDMVIALDGMLQHELSDNGENFSVGERQMLCMARALLRKSRVVVMDEATASIDVRTEQKLQRMIQREFVDATVLTIAHRLSTVLALDRILVLSDGRVVEFDTPRALAQVEGGVFRELAKESDNLPQLLT